MTLPPASAQSFILEAEIARLCFTTLSAPGLEFRQDPRTSGGLQRRWAEPGPRAGQRVEKGPVSKPQEGSQPGGEVLL